MRPLRARDISLGAAVTVAAFALLASVVTGREDSAVPLAAIATAPASPPGAREDQPVSGDDLDLERLKRPKREGAPKDLFAGRSWTPPPPPPPAPAPAAKPSPPPVPAAPPLPYRYLGRLADNERLVVFLARNQDALSASAGDTLDNAYRVESVSESAVVFTYLPLNLQQTLAIPAPQ